MSSAWLYAIDPGTRESALVVFDADAFTVRFHITAANQVIVDALINAGARADLELPGVLKPVLVVEQIEAMGMAVGREVFETVWWAGRFHQAWRWEAHRVTRRAVKLNLCGRANAKDPNIRQAVLDRFGGSIAHGTKKQPGPLYGVHGHEIAALAVALTFHDTRKDTHAEPAVV